MRRWQRSQRLLKADAGKGLRHVIIRIGGAEYPATVEALDARRGTRGLQVAIDAPSDAAFLGVARVMDVGTGVTYFVRWHTHRRFPSGPYVTHHLELEEM